MRYPQWPRLHYRIAVREETLEAISTRIPAGGDVRIGDLLRGLGLLAGLSGGVLNGETLSSSTFSICGAKLVEIGDGARTGLAALLIGGGGFTCRFAGTNAAWTGCIVSPGAGVRGPNSGCVTAPALLDLGGE